MSLDCTSIIIWVVIGLIAGWLAGVVVKGRGFGLIGNIIVGIIGAVIGGFVFPLLGLSASGFIGQTLFAFGGAVLLLIVIMLIRRI
jgi:uncharacterized membrane protein YeaQ/YmgE (transglycosylase-associated protein family)